MSRVDFHIDPSVAHFNVLFEVYLNQLQNSRPELGGLATGAIIFSNHMHNHQQQRVLLVQRAPHDSMPNKWEIAGGAVDGGETILGGLVREVREEVGLRVIRVRGLVRMADDDGLQGGDVFRTTRGRHVAKYTFVVDVDDASKVKLDPNEHQNYVWATEHECRGKQVARGADAQLQLQFTTPAQEEAILKAFADYQ